ncbi:MAG: glycosyltransferase [Elainellaceae cyanobacterium]
MSQTPIALIYCDELLAYSATFVRSQAEALHQFTPVYVGCRTVSGLELPGDRTHVINPGGLSGKLTESAFKLLGIAPGFTSRLRQLKPALLHAHFGPHAVRAMPLAKTLGVPLITTFHGYGVTMTDDAVMQSKSYSHKTYVRRRGQLQRQGHLFIAISDFIRGKMLEQGYPSEKVVVHYVGIDTQLFQPEPTIRREPIVLFTGRLVEKKGCEYLIRAMSQVQQVMPDVELVIIGDGPLRDELERQAQATLKRYRFLGIQPPEQVRHWMNRARLFCVPSIIAESGDAETFGIVFAEAQAMGLPPVSFASGGIPEAIAHEETGLLAPERDWRALAEHILRVLNDSDLWQYFSHKGQMRVRAQFDLHRQTQHLEELYHTVLSSSSTPCSTDMQIARL